MQGRVLTKILGCFLLVCSGLSYSGNAEQGAKVFQACQSCHAVGAGADHLVGPHLNNLFGRVAGSLDNFNYSAGLRAAGANGMSWDAEHLDAYIENPIALVRETSKRFAGLASAEDRNNLIAFLRANSVGPSDISESLPTSIPRDPDVDPQILAITGDPEYGEYLASECMTCHQSDGADRGIPSIVGWPTKQFVIVLHAYKSTARPNPVMQMIAANLADEDIAALAAYFEKQQ